MSTINICINTTAFAALTRNDLRMLIYALDVAMPTDGSELARRMAAMAAELRRCGAVMDAADALQPPVPSTTVCVECYMHAPSSIDRATLAVTSIAADCDICAVEDSAP